MIWKKLPVSNAIVLALGFLFAAVNPPPQTPNTGTSIVYVRLPSTIWVGTDSLYSGSSVSKLFADYFGCKISHHDRQYFSFTGIRSLDGMAGYDAVQQAELSSTRLDGSKEVRNDFTVAMIPALKRALPEIKRRFPDFYAERIVPPKLDPTFVFFEAIFFGFREGRSEISYAGFHALRDKAGELTVTVTEKDCPGANCVDDKPVLEPIGLNKAFQPPFKFDSVSTGRPVEDIRKLIMLEENAEPKYVGGNINIIRIDSTGAHWETNYPECRGK
jgi:hypothetical protein